MVPRVLVITPHAAFGELFRQSLEQNGDYVVQVCATAAQALAQAQKTHFAVAILDSDIGDQPFVVVGQTLLSRYTGMRLVLLPPGNDPHSPLINGLKPHAFLDKPFYLPEMLEVVGEQAQQAAPVETAKRRQPTEKITSETATWQIVSGGCQVAADTAEAASQLAQLALDPGAEAGLIVQRGSLCLFAGQLPRSAAEELTNHLMLYWETSGGEDLTRFVRLKSNAGKQSMMYATALGSESVLALVYAENTPFSHIRGQAIKIARSLGEFAPQVDESATAGAGWVREVDQTPIDVTRLTAEAAVQPLEVREETPAPSALSDLAYTCALTPLDPARLLTGALAGQLDDCLQEIFQSQGWQLERVAVRPHALEWVARVPPELPPADMLRVVRQQTAERIAASAGDEGEAGGIFWAPRYVIVGGARHLSARVLHAFAEEARKA